jgi:hypothetical protein
LREFSLHEGEGNQMSKLTRIAAAFAFLTMQPAFAADEMKCDNTSMMKMQSEVDAMSSSMKAEKDMAMKHMDMAKASMKANKMEDCKMHMDQATKAMKKS